MSRPWFLMRSAIRETGALWRRCNSRAVAGKMQEESRASVGPECTNRLEEEKKKKKRDGGQMKGTRSSLMFISGPII